MGRWLGWFLSSSLLLLISCTTAHQGRTPNSSTEPQLTIKTPHGHRAFGRSELLRSPRLKKIVTKKDPAFPGREMTYFAVPAHDLFQDFKVDENAAIVFQCLDGFSAPLLASRLLNQDPRSAIAYVAIEQPHEKWPAIKPNFTPSPFYLIWENPEKSNISQEEWPFQLASFEVKSTIESEYPKIVPERSLPETHPIRQGYQAFLKNCFACHTLNTQGPSKMGPDLNQPHSPTEYFKPTFLAKLIRDPQSLRHWPQAKMAGFDSNALPDQDLRNILKYLQHMAQRKRQ